MKKEYDFSKGKRGAIIPTPGMTRITIHIDDDILEWLSTRIRKECRGSYHAYINKALHAFINSEDGKAADIVHKKGRAASDTKTARKKRLRKD